jgi:hypothetical protein
MTSPKPQVPASNDSDDFWSALRTGALLGAAALVIALPALHYWKRPVPTTFPNAPAVVQRQAPAPTAAVPAPQDAPPLRLASFGDQHPTDAVRQVANWSVYSGDHQKMAIVIVDKKDARVWVFDPEGKFVSHTPALLGAAIGDDSVPGIGDKPLSQVRPEEKTTPAGRFIAEPGNNANGEDVVWVRAAGVADPGRQPHLLRLHQPAAEVLRRRAQSHRPQVRRRRLRAAGNAHAGADVRCLRRVARQPPGAALTVCRPCPTVRGGGT